PRPVYVVVDEAHRLENEATRAYSIEINQKEFENFSKNLTAHVGPLFYLLGQTESDPEKIVKHLRDEANQTSSMLLDHLGPLKDVMEAYFKKMPRYTDIYWNETPMIKKAGANEAASAAIRNHLESLAVI